MRITEREIFPDCLGENPLDDKGINLNQSSSHHLFCVQVDEREHLIIIELQEMTRNLFNKKGSNVTLMEGLVLPVRLS